MLMSTPPLPQAAPQLDATHFPSVQSFPVQDVSHQRIVDADSEGQDVVDRSHRDTPCREGQVAQESLHLPSTVPESQAVQQLFALPSFQERLAPPADPLPAGTILPSRMTSQNSPHDTQEISPSRFVEFIKAQKAKSTNGLGEISLLQSAEDGFKQPTKYTQDSCHLDLGLFDSMKDDGEALRIEPDTDSEPIDFSPTQATQNKLSQFPESQRFRTPGTHGKKRNYLGQTVGSPGLPRNPLAQDILAKEHPPALGLSQVFAATQAASSPVMMRHVSAPTSDRPSPNIEMQTRPVTASLSSPLRPYSSVKKIHAESQAHYRSMKQSKAERDKIATCTKDSDPVTECEHFDDDFEGEPSFITRQKRHREKEERVRQQFEQFSSTTRNDVLDSHTDHRPKVDRVCEPPQARDHPQQPESPLGSKEADTLSPAESVVNSGAETDRQEAGRLVTRSSSQRHFDDDDEDKDEVSNRAVQVPETVVRLDQSPNEQAQLEESPSLRRSYNIRTSDSTHALPMADSTSKDKFVENSSPMLAVVNSQPDQPISTRTRTLSSQPPQLPSRSPHISSPATASTHVGSISRFRGTIDKADKDQSEQEQSRVEDQDYDQVLNDASLHDQYRMPEAPDESRHQYQSVASRKQNASERSSRKNNTAQLSEHSKLSSKYETANTQVSDESQSGRLSRANLTSPSGRKRKRLGDIAALPFSKTKEGDEDLAEVAVLVDNSEFLRATENIVESSSPIARGRHSSRLRFGMRRASTTRTMSASSRLPSSPPTSVFQSEVKMHRTPIVKERNDRGFGRRRAETIWDVQDSPSKSAPLPTTRGTAQKCESVSKDRWKLGQRNANRGKRPRSNAVDKGGSLHEERKANPSTTGSVDGALEAQQVQTPFPETMAPDKVFARFNGNPRGYYPAKCVGSTGTKADNTLRYQVQWDEVSQDNVDEHGIRGLDLRLGDQVKVSLQGWPRVPHIVRGFQDRLGKHQGKMSDIRGYQSVLLEPKGRRSLSTGVYAKQVAKAPISAIYLDTNMWAQMRPRSFDFGSSRMAFPPESPSGSCMPTPPEPPSTSNTFRSRTRRKTDLAAQSMSETSTLPRAPAATGIFSNMAFAISYPEDRRKSSLGHEILANGGVLLEDGFHEMFEPDGEPSRASVVHDLTLKPRFSATGFTALITERHSRRPKYLQALALNLPCLSGRWIEACITTKATVDWRPYLLAAGESIALEGALRSRILSGLDNIHSARVKDLIAHRPNLLGHHPAIVVTGTGEAGDGRMPYLFLTKVAGAGNVDRCSSLKQAKTLLASSSSLSSSSLSSSRLVEQDQDQDPEQDHAESTNTSSGKKVEEKRIHWVFVDDKSLSYARTMLPTPSPPSVPGKVRGKSRAKAHGRIHGGEGESSVEIKVVANDFLCQSLILGQLV